LGVRIGIQQGEGLPIRLLAFSAFEASCRNSGSVGRDEPVSLISLPVDKLRHVSTDRG
jgi:hypothetical protein